MKNPIHGKYSFWRLTFYINSEVLQVVFYGKKRAITRTFNFSTHGKKMYLATAGAVCVISALLASFLIISGNATDLDMKDDDKVKNRILMSGTTDFINPQKIPALVISEYKVKKGDTLSLIAKNFGVSMDTICGSNALISYDNISEGASLKIPSREGMIIKMGKGETIASVSKKYKVNVHRVLAENRIKNPDFISENDSIFIPDAKPQNVMSGFIWPVSNRQITAGYGWRRDPFGSGVYEFHQGLDIRANYEWVKASKYGMVSYSGWLGGYGMAVVIAHPNGWKTLYAHLSQILVKNGQYVKQGQIVARSGNTGRSTGAHLHFEVIKNGAHKNPYQVLKGNTKL